MNRSIRLVNVLAAFAVMVNCGVQIRPLMPKTDAVAPASATQLDPRVVLRFFDEEFVAGGYEYTYPDESKVFIPEESGKNGEVSLEFDLIPDDYSGGSVCLYNLLYDMTPYYATGALQFWIRGTTGGEVAWVALVDDENTDGKKTVVRVPVNNYGGITGEWRQISVPLADFTRRGVYWDAKKRVEIPEPFQWNKVAEFRIEIKKNDNVKFRVRVDDIFVLRDVFEAKSGDEQYWDERREDIEPPPQDRKPAVTTVHTAFGDDVPAGAFLYVYGGKTAFKVNPTTANGNTGVLTMYQDNADYSGVTIELAKGKTFDLSTMKNTAAGIGFWLKTIPGVTKIYLGLLDDDSDGPDKKVQSKVSISDFGKIGPDWTWFMVPLKKFADQGLWYDNARKAEVAENVDWAKINGVRFSVNRYENKLDEGEPVVIHVDDVTFIREIPGYVDPDEYWNTFTSDAPDRLLHDMEKDRPEQWETAFGTKSEIKAELVASDDPAVRGTKSLRITYKLGDYCDAFYDYPTQNAPAELRDWSKHRALRLMFHSEKPYTAVTVQVSDAGNEIYVSNVGGQRGWNDVLVPFKSFNKFPYYQPPDAVENGRFDLENVRRIDFKPSGEGTSGTYSIDNVRLTNLREIEKPKAPEAVAVTVTASDKVVTHRINEGIFGINAALWDGDLLLPATETFVKAANHAVIRYPGGLRADEDRWKEVMERKDGMVDTDEFLEFCKKTGTTAMITANFGRGTPQEAADWVRHVNIEREQGVKLWEIGNEIYGDWHPNVTTADDYGKRAAGFIKAMKAVDPSIKVAVVWVLEGAWNKAVFGHTRDLADAVIVHHYPQHTGEENDFALLSAPQSLDEIIPAVRRQVADYGTPGKQYEVWLTEWNSVDFEPGPQTLGPVNGLFVIDYLAMLAKHNIEQASYWDIHNAMTPQGGDYGYLSRVGAPDGDNVPRPSYWAFRLAAGALRGTLYESATDNDQVTAYLLRNPDGRNRLLVVNKMPQTKAELKLSVPSFKGRATVQEFTPATAATGLVDKTVTIDGKTPVVVPPYSAWVITVE